MNDLIPVDDKNRAPVRARMRDPHTNEFSRLDVANNIEAAFRLIGGVDRLTLWANANPGEFFTKVYPKLLPASSVNINGDNTKVVVEHVLPATELDKHE